MQDGCDAGAGADEFGPSRGGYALPRLFRFLESLEASEKTDLNTSLRDYSIAPRRAGLIVLISDLLVEDGYETGLRQLLSRGHEAALLHILAPDEIDPPLAGDLQLVDIETNAEQEVSIDGGLRNLYRTRVREWIQSTQADCRKHGIKYLDLVTDRPWDQALMLEMRKAGVVK